MLLPMLASVRMIKVLAKDPPLNLKQAKSRSFLQPSLAKCTLNHGM